MLSTFHRPCVAVAIGLVLVGCGEQTDTDVPASDGVEIVDGSDFTRSAMLENLAHVIGSTYEELVVEAIALVDATDAHVVVLDEDGDGAATLVAVQEAWSRVMAVWQRAEVYQLGPAASKGPDAPAAAQGIRDEIYSWPLVNTCRVDQETVEGAFSTRDFFNDELVNVYGLDAVEYLVFHNETSNSCPPQAAINEEGTWETLSDSQIALSRAHYAQACAGNVLVRAEEILASWTVGDGSFARELAAAGDTSTLFSSEQEAINDLFDAMFYVEKGTRDQKLGRPAGIYDCAGVSCPDEVESPYAQQSKEHVVNNLKAFQMLFLGSVPGGDGSGFDDYLAAVGAEPLAQDMKDNLTGAIAAVEAIEGSLHEAAANLDAAACDARTEPICAAYAALKRVTDDLKTRFVTILSLELPREAEGDND